MSSSEPEIANATGNDLDEASSINAVVGSLDAASVGSDTEQMTNSLLALNLNLSEPSVREAVEKGLRSFNSIANACESMVDAITAINAHPDSIKLHFNPAIGLLSDFVQHCKLLISTNGLQPEASEAVVDEVKAKLEEFKQRFQDGSNGAFVMTVNEAPFIGVEFGTQISLVLRIGSVFNVPVFTAYVMRDVFNNAMLDSGESDEKVGTEFTHNSKTITNYSRLDVLLELLLHASEPDPYDAVNVLIARGINALIVSKFAGEQSPNAVIAEECDRFIALMANDMVAPMIIKSVLIAIIQNPNVLTPDENRFSDMFPSGQYVKYLGEVAHRSTLNPADQGPIMMMRGVQAEPDPLTRTDIIVAALTAVNAAMGANAHIVAAGGAAVSYYINDFVNDMNADAFHGDVIAGSGLDVQALEDLKKGCDNIPMNDIDCFVFGEVSRQFLLLFSLYMMILYDNFYERPKRYGVIHEQVTPVQFNLFPGSADRIELFMYGNHNNDANTKLISKRLKKNPKVQLVTQETKCFSQLANPTCGSAGERCKEDGYYMQPIDLVKKEIGEFVVLYESLYTDAHDKPDLKSLLEDQYYKGADNMVSMKTTMLDLICIFCNEDKALFIRIFMARKNPKDFARLRVFIEIYLLQLLRFKSNDAAFLKYKDELIREIKELRGKMHELNQNYYLEQGNIAAAHDATAKQVNADRTAFLELLRGIGRKIVLIPDPLDDRIPATFRKETGMNTIQFFGENPQMKYAFDMSQHMRDLYGTYERVPIESSDQLVVDQAYETWLSDVFNEIIFPPETETLFREKLGRILDKTQDQTYFEVGFNDMPIRSPLMLQLLDALKGVQYDEKLVLKFRPILRQLLKPLKEHIAQYAIKPNAIYVGVRTQPNGLYDKTTKALFPVFVKALLLGNYKMNELNPKTKELIERLDRDEKERNGEFMFDDAVNEEIGRIILAYEANVKSRQIAGSTIKRKRGCRLNAMTRRSKRRFGTRKKSKASKLNCNRSRRALMQ